MLGTEPCGVKTPHIDSEPDSTEIEYRINGLDSLSRNFRTILNRQESLYGKLNGPQVEGAGNPEEPPYSGQIGQLSQVIEHLQKTFDGMADVMDRLEKII